MLLCSETPKLCKTFGKRQSSWRLLGFCTTQEPPSKARRGPTAPAELLEFCFLKRVQQRMRGQADGSPLQHPPQSGYLPQGNSFTSAWSQHLTSSASNRQGKSLVKIRMSQYLQPPPPPHPRRDYPTLMHLQDYQQSSESSYCFQNSKTFQTFSFQVELLS